MANSEDKHPENVAGPFFTDTECILCDLCLEAVPAVFKATEDRDHAYVHRQPANAEELELVREALEHCPVEAIGETIGETIGEAIGEAIGEDPGEKE